MAAFKQTMAQINQNIQTLTETYYYKTNLQQTCFGKSKCRIPFGTQLNNYAIQVTAKMTNDIHSSMVLPVGPPLVNSPII